MPRFEVWAPAAGQVELALNGQHHAMLRRSDGRWACDVPAEPGSRYGFSVDGGPIRPDPRSPYQPEGVHALSATVDHARFAWGDGSFRGFHFPGSVLYELHIGTFTPEGTFDSAIARLPHLVDLGVDAVELLPVAEFSGDRGWGYDGVHLYAPHHAYGGPEGLKRLVDACHQHGLGVIMDVVYNHLGPVGNYLSQYGEYFSKHHHTHWGEGLNFDGRGAFEVRRWVIDNALMWLRDYHCDGLRLDAVHAIVDQSSDHLLREMADEVHALSAAEHRPLWLIAECDLNDPRFVQSKAAGGYGLQAAWADDWHHAVHALLTGERSGYYEDYGSLDALAKALRQAWVFDGCWSQHRQRRHGGSPATLRGDQMVVSVQNHDQVGNRAQGDRLSHGLNPSRQKMAAAWLLTSPFTPMIFHGEEWGASSPFLYFTDHDEPELAQAVREGRRREFAAFGWEPERIPDPQADDTFRRSQLRWEELQEPSHRELFEWYRSLIALRRARQALCDPRLSSVAVTWDAQQRWIAIHRGPIAVISNLGQEAMRLQLSPSATPLLSTTAVHWEHGLLSLPAEATAVMDGVSAADMVPQE